MALIGRNHIYTELQSLPKQRPDLSEKDTVARYRCQLKQRCCWISGSLHNGMMQRTKNNSPTAYIERKIVRYVPVAQWIARWTSNPKVTSSNITWDGLVTENV
ncbi:hypothetical protein TNCV_2112131 [Trichonephila clavipes]|nr:hypothetical protein TNCV_2112131 [Trichonephila clavipes]